MALPQGTEDHRRAARLRTIKGARLALPDSDAAFSCVLRNLSEVGGMVELPSTIGVPDELVLETTDGHLRRPCQVVWRTETRMGLDFTD